jgi:hypothetical protein
VKKAETVAKETNAVRQFVKDQLEANAMADDIEEFQDYNRIQVNVRLHSLNVFTLEHLAEKLRMSRPELAEQLLLSAIADAWDELGLPNLFESTELKEKAIAFMEEKKLK